MKYHWNNRHQQWKINEITLHSNQLGSNTPWWGSRQNPAFSKRLPHSQRHALRGRKAREEKAHEGHKALHPIHREKTHATEMFTGSSNWFDPIRESHEPPKHQNSIIGAPKLDNLLRDDQCIQWIGSVNWNTIKTSNGAEKRCRSALSTSTRQGKAPAHVKQPYTKVVLLCSCTPQEISDPTAVDPMEFLVGSTISLFSLKQKWRIHLCRLCYRECRQWSPIYALPWRRDI